MWERTLTINSTGKTFSMTGWKIGYAIGPAALNAAIRAVHQFVTFATATPFQEAMAEAIEQAAERDFYPQLAAEYDERRRGAGRCARRSGDAGVADRWQLLPDGRHLRSRLSADVEFCRWLVSNHGVAAVPPSAFYLDAATAPLLARFCFAKRLDTIAEARTRLRNAFG